VERPKAHHYIPAAHLSRFSPDPESIPARDRTLAVYSKRDGGFRRAKAGKLAFENDLYTFRIPDLTGVQPDADELVRAVLDPSNKDGEIEVMKAEIEDRGLAAMRHIETWDLGPRVLSPDERTPLLAYAGLLLAQHPTMMAARADAVSRSFWQVVGGRIERDPMLETLTAEMDQGTSAMAVIFDGLATAQELMYLAWHVIRRPTGPAVILGDVGVASWYPGRAFGVGDPWYPGGKFVLPISTTTIVVFGEVNPGVCLVEELGPLPSEIAVHDVISWGRSRSEVFGSSKADIERVLAGLGPLDPRSDNSTQLAVRESVLPRFELDHSGNLKITHPSPPNDDDTKLRFAARFPNFRWAEP
jgi:hypothetical protein